MNDKTATAADSVFGDAAAENDNANTDQDLSRVMDDFNQLKEDRDRFLDLLQRTKADFENYQKRALRDMEQERKYALVPLARDLLPAIDNLERALSSVKEETPLSKGVAMVQSQLFEALKRHGVTRIEAIGKPFDPNLHQAVMQQPDAKSPPNTVLQVLQAGFMLHDRVLRPSSVIVSKTE